MQINEIFKILDGPIRLVDNIGLMGEESQLPVLLSSKVV
jgi:hypothetical protein